MEQQLETSSSLSFGFTQTELAQTRTYTGKFAHMDPTMMEVDSVKQFEQGAQIAFATCVCFQEIGVIEASQLCFLGCTAAKHIHAT